jgi:hypothetical protein
VNIPGERDSPPRFHVFKLPPQWSPGFDADRKWPNPARLTRRIDSWNAVRRLPPLDDFRRLQYFLATFSEKAVTLHPDCLEAGLLTGDAHKRQVPDESLTSYRFAAAVDKASLTCARSLQGADRDRPLRLWPKHRVRTPLLGGTLKAMPNLTTVPQPGCPASTSEAPVFIDTALVRFVRLADVHCP